MSVFRILTLPLGLFAFAAIYSASIKAPGAVEIASLMLCTALPVIMIAKLIRKVT